MTSPSDGKGLRVDLLAEKILQQVVDHFQASGVQLPARRIIAPGDPTVVAWDCEQLTVSMVGIGWGISEESFVPNMQAAGNAVAMSSRHIVYAIELVRCSPGSDQRDGSVDMATLNAAGLSFMRDCGLLSQAMVTMVSRLKQELPRGTVARPGIVDPKGPSGGYFSAVTTFYVSCLEIS